MFNKRRESAMPDKWVSPPYLNLQKNKLGPVELCKDERRSHRRENNHTQCIRESLFTHMRLKSSKT